MDGVVRLPSECANNPRDARPGHEQRPNTWNQKAR